MMLIVQMKIADMELECYVYSCKTQQKAFAKRHKQTA